MTMVQRDADARDTCAWWEMQRGSGPIIATAIHDGTGLRPEVRERMALPDADRVREEDPFTGQAVKGVPTHVIAGRSRFEVDLNRAAGEAVYRTPDQAWGLDVWRSPLDDAFVQRSVGIHQAFYAMMRQLLDSMAAEHGRFVVLDVHSYNHRRDGPDARPTPQADAPDINIGTISMPRERWSFLLDPLIEAMREFDYLGGKLDVRENVAFQGRGELTRFVHAHYPSSGCAIAIEFKKFYMDEWTGQPDQAHLGAMRAFIDHVAATCRGLLDA
ncbi:N-formylglutamate amidohydrolase [Luteimonas vadosa]|uniref:N-formylglutamate amidohydrolase n=1 Tax=Luteimonas vadosa TaxID=1165507 RepID=A0ABP9E4A9_9GAMM